MFIRHHSCCVYPILFIEVKSPNSGEIWPIKTSHRPCATGTGRVSAALSQLPCHNPEAPLTLWRGPGAWVANGFANRPQGVIFMRITVGATERAQTARGKWVTAD